MRIRSIRLRDVAHHADVSLATVSRYLNRSLALPAATAARIDAAIRKLGYQPNPHARRLSLGRSESIGLVVPDLFNPFFAQLADAVEQAAEAAGLELLLCATRNRLDRELDYLARLQRTLVDGLLFLTNHADDGRLCAAINASRNVVLLDEDVPGAAVSRVFADNAEGGYMAGGHLIAAGHRRLAFVGGPRGMLTTRERLAGFRRAVRASGTHRVIVAEDFGDYTAAHGRAAARMLLDSGATAAFVASDEIAFGLLEAFSDLGVSVPDAMSLIAFDDVGPLHLLRPPLTAIAQPVAAMGQRGIALLLAGLAGVPGDPPATIRLPVHLVARGSVTAPKRARPLARA
jgi:LacI family transcriptional regulator